MVRHDDSATRTQERLRLLPSPRIEGFFEAAAAEGLDVALAVRLALERALVLLDGQSMCIDPGRICRLLNDASRDARAACPLSSQQADYVRLLFSGRSASPTFIECELLVAVPDDLMTRVRNVVSEAALDETAVPEMLAWERAARLQGRTMLEWSLVTLGRSVRAGRSAYGL